uniref:Uncharacterized protein n=1 Tax=Pithovirus LCPAC001 TaxID=2506585 RepID=A0A481Z3Y2_9VIRU|nr:MAG: hypothetical protein LCPAC001_02020 [Pithovirus LCPAC001]
MTKTTFKHKLTTELVREALCTHGILDASNIEKLAKYIADQYCLNVWTVEELFLFLDHSNLQTYIGYNSTQFNTKLDYLIVSNKYFKIKNILIDIWPEYDSRDDLADQKTQIENLFNFQHKLYSILYTNAKTVMSQHKYRILPYFKKYKVHCLNQQSEKSIYDIRLTIYRLNNDFPSETITNTIFP